MKINDLLDKTLRELLEEYCTVYNLECGYYYGVCRFDDVDKLFKEYNIQEYSEAFEVENLINEEIIVSFDEEIMNYDKLVKIMNNLGIHKKNNNIGD